MKEKKTCSKCKVEKPVIDFYWNEYNLNYISHCKSCKKEHHDSKKDIVKDKKYSKKPLKFMQFYKK